MKTRLCHELLHFYYKRARCQFEADSRRIEVVQRAKLKSILSNLAGSNLWQGLQECSYEQLRDQVPVRNYSEFENLIQEQRKSGRPVIAPKVVRFEPTSGSTHNRKWIPYTREFLDELNAAAAVWLGDVYGQHPNVKSGRHYWSLSWLPEELRSLMSNDDADLFPFFQRVILKSTMAVPSQISKIAKAEAAWWATLILLASQQELSLVSVWSPTYWLKVTDDLRMHWDVICGALTEGHWGLHSREIESVLGPAPQRVLSGLVPEEPDFFKKLWPRLNFLSAWDSSTSKPWFEELQARFPDVAFQGKGLWATEGVVSIPLGSKKVLALSSHFYEFRNLKSGDIHPSWNLQAGEIYQPLIWSSSGLLRYETSDLVQVREFHNQVPCLEFLGRLRTVDMVGEKMTAEWVRSLFLGHPEWQAVCLVACREPHPHYVLVHQNKNLRDSEVESHLSQAFHYQVAREIGQLGPARSFSTGDPQSILARLSRSAIAGQNKIEMLLQIESWPVFSEVVQA